nr:T9SS type A sorting domain-containing protein [Chitinophagaceae bacterium]
ILTDNFKIYPITADNQINIEYKFNENETAYFILFDMLGRRRLQTQLIGDVYKTTLNVSNLETGVSLYQIQKQDNSFIKGKIIIE